jgi:Resolvase, N terminal domain
LNARKKSPTKAAGYYVAGVYRERASGARADRPELLRMIADLQPGEVVIAEKIDRISRLPLAEAERLVASIRDKGARLAVPGVVDRAGRRGQGCCQDRARISAGDAFEACVADGARGLRGPARTHAAGHRACPAGRQV